MKVPPVESRTALITGCSSGIGQATAHVLRDAGWQVFPTARKASDLDQLRADGFDPIPLDLLDHDSVEAAVRQLLDRTGGSLGALVNNAGIGQGGALDDVDRDTLRHQFEVNLFGLHDLTHELLPTFRKQGYGRIVNVSSVLGRISAPMLGCYCASKFALEALSDAMRIELLESGIWVSLVEPGPIISEFRRNAVKLLADQVDTEAARFGEAYQSEYDRRIEQVKRPNLFTRPPEEVGYKIRHALQSRRPRRRYCVTIPAYIGDFAARFVPQALTDRLQKKSVPTPQPTPSVTS
jgi:NAD(P)-dependent dehydrogenase (short-subunit alcohol dehydrogenase family)